MADLRKFLDREGLGVLWDQIKAKFIDNAELTATLANYESKEELAEVLARYFTKDEVNTLLNALDARKVDKEISTDAGKALIFNEADGGGAKFENADGVESFVGVNNGGANGIAAQIYADKLINGKWQGAKLDVTNEGIYYTVGNQSATDRDVPGNELAVKGDIAEYSMVKDEDAGEYAAVYHLTRNGVNVGAAINIAKDQLLKSVTVKTCTEKDKPISGLDVGDKYIDFEFETTAGTEHSYIAVKDLVKPYEADEETITLDSNNVFSVKAVPMDKVTGLDSALDNKASVSELSVEASARAAADAELDSGKLDIMPGDDYTSGNAYNLPYYFYTVPSADKVSVHTKTVTLDGNKIQGDYSIDVLPASSSVAGLMSAVDKDKLDSITSLTQQEIEDICK